MVNQDKPEANWGFGISLVKQVEHQNYHCDLYHIRHATGITMEDEWEAMVPVKKYPSLAERIVLVRGPSQDYFHQDAERYHQDSFCAETKKAHETLQTNIAADKSRQECWWLLVFPEGTVLENHIISGDAVHVKKEFMELSEKNSAINEKGKTEEVEQLSGEVYWRIALTGGERLRSPAPSKKKKRQYVKK
jgi:hypothetical protein